MDSSGEFQRNVSRGGSGENLCEHRERNSGPKGLGNQARTVAFEAALFRQGVPGRGLLPLGQVFAMAGLGQDCAAAVALMESGLEL